MHTNIVKIETSYNDINMLSQSIWFSGCNNGKGKCVGCHNKILFEKQKGLTLDKIENILKQRRKISDWIIYLGGEPLENLELLEKLVFISDKYKYRQLLFTGFELQEIKDIKHILKYIDYIKIGRYLPNQNKKNYHFASINQNLWKVENGLITNKIYYYGIQKSIEGVINEN